MWLRGTVDDGSDQRGGTREFESEMFKGVSCWDGDRCYFNVLSVNSSNSAPATFRARLVNVGKSRGCDLVE